MNENNDFSKHIRLFTIKVDLIILENYNKDKTKQNEGDVYEPE